VTGAPPPAALVGYAREADPLLREFLARKGRDLEGLPVDLRPVHEALTDYVLRGGKRVRGALAILGCEAAGAKAELARNASLGLELLHAYLLIRADAQGQLEGIAARLERLEPCHAAIVERRLERGAEIERLPEDDGLQRSGEELGGPQRALGFDG